MRDLYTMSYSDDQQDIIWNMTQESGLTVWLFAYHGVGVFWSACGWIIYINTIAQSVVEPNQRGTVHLLILLFVIWPLLHSAIIGGLGGVDWLLHGDLWWTLMIAGGLSVLYPFFREGKSIILSLVKDTMAMADDFTTDATDDVAGTDEGPPIQSPDPDGYSN